MKALLVIDMPNVCENCLLNVDGECAVTRELVHSISCPLKPIVFCEECKYADKLGEWSKYDYSCKYFNTHSVNKGNFCSYGVRKE